MPDEEGLRELEKHQELQRRGLEIQTCRRGTQFLEIELNPGGI